MKTTRALSAAALLSSVSAQYGEFAVVNHCAFDLYLWSVAGGAAPGQMITLPGGQPEIGYKETYRTTPNNGGVSVKVAPYYAQGNSVPSTQIIQLEYTVPSQTDPAQASVKDLIFYDLSWVDGNPFNGIPLTMQTSLGQSGNPCPSGTCGTNNKCDVGYLWSTDDVKTHACALSADVIWTFCSGPGGTLGVKTGLIGRDAEPEPVPEAKAAAAAEAEPLAVCVQVGSNVAQLCPDSTTSTPPPAATTSAAPVVALQKPQSVALTTTSTSAPAPIPTAPAPIQNPSGGPVSLNALTNLQDSGVSKWITFDGSTFSKRDLHGHSAHRHNHAAFHRRNRIIRSA